MDFSQYQQWVAPAAFLAFIAWRFLKFRSVRNQIPALIAQGGIIVDVRSPGEYASGAVSGSINIPLNDLERGSAKLDRAKPVIVCCASGTRSAMAAAALKRKGFATVINAGPWTNVPRT